MRKIQWGVILLCQRLICVYYLYFGYMLAVYWFGCDLTVPRAVSAPEGKYIRKKIKNKKIRQKKI